MIRPGRAPSGAVPFPWETEAPGEGRLAERFFARPVDEVARDLLGARLVSTLGGEPTWGVIVETEAYRGADDPASHARARTGRTRRNRAMFGPPGRAYLYRIYGVHWCLNVVTGREGEAQAVLIRGLDPRGGTGTMARRRGGSSALASGPGRLCQALGVDGSLYGHPLGSPPLEIRPGWGVPEGAVGVSGRVGVRAAAHWPLRFFVRGNPGVSRGPAAVAPTR